VIQWGAAPGNERKIHLPLIGEFQALNALCAAGIAMSLGDDVNAVLDGLTQLKGVHGQLELVGQTATKAPVFVDYAHTPDGLNVLLRAARPHVRGEADRGVRLRRRSRRDQAADHGRCGAASGGRSDCHR